MSSLTPNVFLLCEGDVVGTAKIFLQPSTNVPATSIHGHPLTEFPCNGFNPVAIYFVRIYNDHSNKTYPYKFRSIDGNPVRLGELNEGSEHFNAIVAWDRDMLTESSEQVGPAHTAGSSVAGSGVPGSRLESSGVAGPGVAGSGVAGSGVTESVVASGHNDDRDVAMYDEGGAPSNVDELERGSSNKRVYTYKVRKKGAQVLSSRRLHWKELGASPENPFLKKRSCCRRLQCFKHVDKNFAFAQFKRLIDMSCKDRKQELIDLLDGPTARFRFNGRFVCSRFLWKAFKFSSTIQSCVKGTPGARASPSAERQPREVYGDTISDEIVLYLEGLAESFGDRMPNKPYVNVPNLTKLEVYNDFCMHFMKRRQQLQYQKAPALNYFYTVWDKECSHIKTYRTTGFATCSKCEMLRSKIAAAVKDRAVVAGLKQDRKLHLAAIRRERRGYKHRASLAAQEPGEFMSICIDGADQKYYGLPHFRIETKADRGHKIKVKCIGALEHQAQNVLTLYTMTEEYYSGANHVLEVAHRILQYRKQSSGRLPKTLFVQVDNTSRENKNRYFFAYFEMLVARGVFVEVQVSFLPVGHTHIDIDQAFSVVAGRLRHADAFTMAELLEELRRCFDGKARAFELDSIANFSELCKETRCLANVQNLTDFRFFKFVRDENQRTGEFYLTKCIVKKTETDSWTSLSVTPQRGASSSRLPKGFLVYVPPLERMPAYKTRVPTNVVEVNKCLQSMEERMRSTEQLQQLEDLKNKVYTPRVEVCMWDLSCTFETNGDYRVSTTDMDMEQGSEDDEAVDEAVDDLQYTPNDFVAVRTRPQEADRFWIAQILRVSRFKEGRPCKLFVQWYNPVRSATDIFSAAYEMATKKITTETGGERNVLYKGHVDVRAVMVVFPSLSVRSRLLHSTRVLIRSALNM